MQIGTYTRNHKDASIYQTETTFDRSVYRESVRGKHVRFNFVKFD